MAFTLYDATVGSFVQILGASENLLAKGRAHFESNGIDLEEALNFRLIEDMLPLRFQINSVAFHSQKAIEGAREGLFSPSPPAQRDFVGLQSLLSEAKSDLQDLSPDDINDLTGKEVVFQMKNFRMNFTAEDFLMSFSIPNFYFHASTLYDILRWKGVPVGKADFLGRMRILT